MQRLPLIEKWVLGILLLDEIFVLVGLVIWRLAIDE
jgi:hypothetical protein